MIIYEIGPRNRPDLIYESFLFYISLKKLKLSIFPRQYRFGYKVDATIKHQIVTAIQKYRKKNKLHNVLILLILKTFIWNMASRFKVATTITTKATILHYLERNTLFVCFFFFFSSSSFFSSFLINKKTSNQKAFGLVILFLHFFSFFCYTSKNIQLFIEK